VNDQDGSFSVSRSGNEGTEFAPVALLESDETAVLCGGICVSTEGSIVKSQDQQ
jgi:hypothetical protein